MRDALLPGGVLRKKRITSIPLKLVGRARRLKQTTLREQGPPT